jgi:hypothetical protein
MPAAPQTFGKLTTEERRDLALRLLDEQIVEARKRLHFWRSLTHQPAQVDSGYISQHLVSLITHLRGQGFRGKGLDLEDGSEIKSANFLDSEDARGAVAPRWNFTVKQQSEMFAYLKCKWIYLVSIDNYESGVRVRVWRLSPKTHRPFKRRFNDWAKKVGFPIFRKRGRIRKDANFQLFPPRNGSEDDYARHGGGGPAGPKKVRFDELKVKLNKPPGSVLLFHAGQKGKGKFKLVRWAV